jgi:hypothetical protein
MVPLVKKLAAAGMTEREIAACLDITPKTLHNWKADHPKLARALIPGKRAANQRVEASLYHRAVGYTCPDTHVAVIKGKVVLTPIVKHYPPSEGAMTLWLTNRLKKRWKNRQSNELTTPPGQPLEVSHEIIAAEPGLVDAYLKRLAAIAEDRAAREPPRGSAKGPRPDVPEADEADDEYFRPR